MVWRESKRDLAARETKHGSKEVREIDCAICEEEERMKERKTENEKLTG